MLIGTNFMRNDQPIVAVRVDLEDYELLKQLAKLEKLNRSEIIRRAIRRLARDAGLLPPEKAGAL